MSRDAVRRSAFEHLEPVEIAGRLYPDYVGMADAYADAVISRKVIENRLVVLACERYRAMRKEADSDVAEFYWSAADVVDACAFIELCPQVEGGADGARLVLEPCQIWITANIFGFRRWFAGKSVRWFTEVLVDAPRKFGKALALDTPIPTPHGWVEMGNIQVGDAVYAIDGSETRVVAVSEVFSDHECYEVEFSNGEVILADAGHQWVTSARVDAPGVRRTEGRYNLPRLSLNRRGWFAQLYRRQVYIGPRTMSQGEAEARFAPLAASDLASHPVREPATHRARTTEEIASTLSFGKRKDRNHSVRMPEPISGLHRDLPIDPYVLGAWLGDGTSDSPRLTCGDADASFFQEQIENAGYVVSARRAQTAWSLQINAKGSDGFAVGKRDILNVRRTLRLMGLLNNKHIPSDYLRASVGQRVALLQGLMDTDGSANKAGTLCEFVTTKAELRDGFCELLASLGIKYSCSSKTPRCNGRLLHGRLAYSIRFCAFRGGIEPFRLPRKLQRLRWASEARMAPRSRTVQIVDARKVAPRPVRCIQVDHPSSQFLCGKTMLPTHNSAYTSALDLYIFLFEEERGSQVLMGASSREQARKVFKPFREILLAESELVEQFSLKVTAEEVRRPDGGFVKMVSSIGRKEDGAIPHVIHIDELHAVSEALYEVFASAMGSRANELFLQTTTAGTKASGPAYAQRKRLERVLKGQEKAPRFFGVIWTIDEEDMKDPLRWENVVKAHPMLGVTLKPETLEDEIEKSRHNPASRAEFIAKRLNVYARGSAHALSPTEWALGADPSLKLKDFLGEECWIGVDLSSHDDMTAIAYIFERGSEVVVFAEHFIPETSPGFQNEKIADDLIAWVEAKWISVTPLPYVDYAFVQARIEEACKLYDVEAVVFDRAHSVQMAGNLLQKGIRAGIIQANSVELSEPTKDIVVRARNGALKHDGNPVLAWNAANVVIPGGSMSELWRPSKDRTAPHMKIDGFSALVHANVARMGRVAAKMPKPVKKFDPNRVIRGLA